MPDQLIDQIVGLLGAIMILTGYGGYQLGWWGRENRIYNALNFVGSSLLLWVAIVDERWGFILLEAVWALISLPPLLRPPKQKEG